VLERKVTGAVHVDEAERPGAAHILHPYGLSLLCGQPQNDSFVAGLLAHMTDSGARRRQAEQLQVYPRDWNGVLRARLGERLMDGTGGRLSPEEVQTCGRERVIELERLNFEFDPVAFASLQLPALAPGLRIARAGRTVLAPWDGVVIPQKFWDSPEDFERDGLAFAVFEADRPLCVAFSAMRLAQGVEIGIETHPAARARGLATHACAALIRFCLENGETPVWSTHGTNMGSQALAARLGYRVSVRLPIYRLAMRGV
jgi:GNAT superfamily N-acetyltransferase